ncbi:ATP-grasp domain-containing protein, partial [Neobacillus niacini]|uniref:ATP-grasp domain-containing protein n=1 Tax=Neobacillus niacini TaxID=86668 RepID=UPI002FFFCDC6
LIKSVSLSKLCKSVHGIEEMDFDIKCKNIREVIKSLIPDNDDNFIIPTGIQSTLYISKNAKEIEGIINYYPISDYKTLAMLNNKWEFYLFLMKHKISTPKTMLFDHSEIQNMRDNLNFPVISKPLDSENSINVIKSETFNDLYKETNGTKIPLLVQEYIPGYDINLCIFSLNGNIKAWTINRRTDKGVVFDNNKEILQIGEYIVKTLNYSGLIHFDLRFNAQDGTFMVLECNPRVWASMLHSAYVGVNFMELAINNQNNEFSFKEIKSGTLSLNKNSLLNKLFKPSLSKQDFKSIFIQTKLFIHDPIYELNFIINKK